MELSIDLLTVYPVTLLLKLLCTTTPTHSLVLSFAVSCDCFSIQANIKSLSLHCFIFILRILLILLHCRRCCWSSEEFNNQAAELTSEGNLDTLCVSVHMIQISIPSPIPRIQQRSRRDDEEVLEDATTYIISYIVSQFKYIGLSVCQWQWQWLSCSVLQCNNTRKLRRGVGGGWMGGDAADGAGKESHSMNIPSPLTMLWKQLNLCYH